MRNIRVITDSACDLSTELVKNYGISKAFHTDFVAEELLAENGMSVENLFNEIKEFVK